MDFKQTIWKMTILLLTVLPESDSSESVFTDNLYNDIFGNYRSEFLPVCNDASEFVNVTLDIALRQIVELNEKDQTLKTNIWVRMIWNDCRLKWNSSDYGGIHHVQMPFDGIWTPDIAVYDSAAEENMMPGLTDFRAKVYNDGTVQYNFPTVLNSLCRVIVTYFPFDKQLCGLRFGSWSHAQRHIDFYPKSLSGDLNDFVINNEWVVDKLSAVRSVKQYDDNYTDINYCIEMTRRSEFYTLTMLFPCILVSAIAAIGFLLPPESGEKVSLEVTVLLSQAVFLLVISDFLPPSADDFPILGIYFAVGMMLVGMSLVMSVLVLNVHHRGDIKGKRVPKWIRKLFLGKSRRCCSGPNYTLDQLEHPEGELNPSYAEQDGIKQNGTNASPIKAMHGRSDDKTNLDSISEQQVFHSIPEALLREQTRTLHQMYSHFAQTDDTDNEREDWQTLARVLDRIFLFFYITCFAVVTAIFLFKLDEDSKIL